MVTCILKQTFKITIVKYTIIEYKNKYITNSNISSNNGQLYSEADLEESMDRIETIDFHEQKSIKGINFWCYHAGMKLVDRNL